MCVHCCIQSGGSGSCCPYLLFYISKNSCSPVNLIQFQSVFLAFWNQNCSGSQSRINQKYEIYFLKTTSAPTGDRQLLGKAAHILYRPVTALNVLVFLIAWLNKVRWIPEEQNRLSECRSDCTGEVTSPGLIWSPAASGSAGGSPVKTEPTSIFHRLTATFLQNLKEIQVPVSPTCVI